MLNNLKKILISGVGVAILTSSIQIVPVAHANVPVLETGPLLTVAKLIAGNTTQKNIQDLKKWAETFVRSTLKKRILDVLVDQIIQYVQGGGKPKFVTDWRGFLEDAGQQAAGDFAKSLELGFLCEPFKLQIQLGLLPVPTFSERATCTLDKIVGNVENFYADFRNGGWLAFTSSWQPNNNPFGSILMALSEQNRQAGNAQKAAELEAVAGAGFLSVKKCKEDADGVIIQSTCVVTTPGKVLGDVVGKAVGSDIDFILSAEQLGDYVAAIANAAINRLITEGAKGLSGVSTKSAPKGGYIPAGTPGTCAGLTGTALQACQNLITDSDNSFTTGKSVALGQINETLLPRQDAQLVIQSSISSTQQYINDLGSLKSFFSGLGQATCPPPPGQFQPLQVSQVIQSISNEQGLATTTLNNLANDFSENQAIIDPIVAAKNQIQNLNAGDWTGLTTILTNITGNLDYYSANNFKSFAEAQQDEINQNISQKLTTFNQQKQQCQP